MVSLAMKQYEIELFVFQERNERNDKNLYVINLTKFGQNWIVKQIS